MLNIHSVWFYLWSRLKSYFCFWCVFLDMFTFGLLLKYPIIWNEPLYMTLYLHYLFFLQVRKRHTPLLKVCMSPLISLIDFVSFSFTMHIDLTMFVLVHLLECLSCSSILLAGIFLSFFFLLLQCSTNSYNYIFYPRKPTP